MPFQNAWRFCTACNCIFYCGSHPAYASRGRCAATQAGHTAEGFDFQLEHDVPEDAGRQGNWRFCIHCYEMVFFGYTPRPAGCPGDGAGHEAQGYAFVLQHSGGEDAGHQAAWEFCVKCSALYWIGYGGGKCVTGGAHAFAPNAYHFVLAHDGSAGMPRTLQFRLRGFAEIQSSDSGLQGATDETFFSAVGVDSAAVTKGPDGSPQVQTTPGARTNQPARELRDAWPNNPFVLMTFDLQRAAVWPRTFTVNLLIVEQDNADLAQAFDKAEQEYGAVIKQAVVTAAGVAAGAAAGAAIGSVIPGIGTAVGAAVGGLAGGGYNAVRDSIKEGLANDVFTPVPVTLTVDGPNGFAGHPLIGAQQKLNVQQYSANYDIAYDWVVG